jgi:plastocyanin
MHLIASFISTLVLASGVVGQYGGTPDMGSGMNAQQNQGNTGGNTAETGMTGSQSMQNGQNGPSSSMMMPPSSISSAMSATGSVAVHVIKVSDKNGSLIYSPASIHVPVGDMVQWHFYPKNHSIVQAAFSNPCTPISNVMPNVTTFFSGYMPVKATDQEMPALTMMVKDALPFWYYCSQGKHCQKGMVGVINP